MNVLMHLSQLKGGARIQTECVELCGHQLRNLVNYTIGVLLSCQIQKSYSSDKLQNTIEQLREDGSLANTTGQVLISLQSCYGVLKRPSGLVIIKGGPK